MKEYEAEVAAYIDTGFEGGFLSVPRSLYSHLGEPDWVREYVIADGTVVPVETFRGNLAIPGLLAPLLGIPILCAGNLYLLGRSVIDRFRTTFDHGVSVTIEA